VLALDRGRHQVGDVARGEALTVRVLERVMQDPVKLEDRGGGEPRLDPPRVEPCEVGWFELGEPQLADVRMGVELEELPVALVGARGDGRLDHLQPGPEVLFDGGALVGDEPPFAEVALGVGILRAASARVLA